MLAGISSVDDLVTEDWIRIKREGWSDAAVAEQCGTSSETAQGRRRAAGVRPVYRRVDSVAGEVEARSNYLYSTWGEAADVAPEPRPDKSS